MTDKAPRTLSEINNEYTALCAQLGQKTYQVSQAEKDVEALVSAIRDINTEAAKSKQFYDALESEKAKASEEKSNVTPIKEGTPNA